MLNDMSECLYAGDPHEDVFGSNCLNELEIVYLYSCSEPWWIKTDVSSVTKMEIPVKNDLLAARKAIAESISSNTITDFGVALRFMPHKPSSKILTALLYRPTWSAGFKDVYNKAQNLGICQPARSMAETLGYPSLKDVTETQVLDFLENLETVTCRLQLSDLSGSDEIELGTLVSGETVFLRNDGNQKVLAV